MPKDKARRTRCADVVTRDYTIHLHKRLHGSGLCICGETVTIEVANQHLTLDAVACENFVLSEGCDGQRVNTAAQGSLRSGTA